MFVCRGKGGASCNDVEATRIILTAECAIKTPRCVGVSVDWRKNARMTSLRRDQMIKKRVFIKTTIKQQKASSSLSLSTESVFSTSCYPNMPNPPRNFFSGKKSILLSKQSRECLLSFVFIFLARAVRYEPKFLDAMWAGFVYGASRVRLSYWW